MQQSKSKSEISILFITQCTKNQPNNPKYSPVQALFYVTMLYLLFLFSKWQFWDLDVDLWKMIPRQSIWLLVWVLRQSVVLGAMDLPLALTCGCVSCLMGLSGGSALLNAALFWLSLWVSLHCLIIFVAVIHFRRYCPSLPAFSILTAGRSTQCCKHYPQPFPVLRLIDLLWFAFFLQLKAQYLWLLLVWGILRNCTQE